VVLGDNERPPAKNSKYVENGVLEKKKKTGFFRGGGGVARIRGFAATRRKIPLNKVTMLNVDFHPATRYAFQNGTPTGRTDSQV